MSGEYPLSEAKPQVNRHKPLSELRLSNYIGGANQLEDDDDDENNANHAENMCFLLKTWMLPAYFYLFGGFPRRDMNLAKPL